MTESFVGQGWAFPIDIGPTGGVATAEGHAKIAQSIELILRTSPGERRMRPDFGCNLRAFVFDPVNETTAGLIRREVDRALRRWEPRIDVDDIDVTAHPRDAAALLISVSYTVRATNDPRNLVFPFYVIPGESRAGPTPSERDGEVVLNGSRAG